MPQILFLLANIDISTLAELEKPTIAELQEELNIQTPEDFDGIKGVPDEQIPPGDPLSTSL